MKNNNWIFWVIGIGSLVFMGVVLFYNYNHAMSLACDQQGIFGDMFGASNALFTGLSFTGVIIAILLQRQELKLQRNELELTREEMKLTRNEFETQNSTLQIQRFENTFFQILSLHHQIIENIETSSTKNITGSEPITTIFKGRIAFIHEYSKLAKNLSNDAKKYDTAYSYFIANRYYLFSHYFKNFFQILKLIDDAELTDVQKIKYVEILKSQLSQHELTFIFYEQKSLIEKFHLFTELNDQFIVTELKAQYLQSAYFI